eukprot:m.132476 g.132476  ORF g.132476 m.132476 type:complete len:292 (+) comp15928_c0_seq1:45-920(+)
MDPSVAAKLFTPTALQSMVDGWLQEDVPSFDIGGAVVGSKPETAELLMKASGVIAGKPFFDAVFAKLDCSVEWQRKEGESVQLESGQRVTAAIVKGEACRLLQGERIALNMLARASGIATRSRHLAGLKAAKGWSGVVAGTRKTTPGFRLVEKHAMLIGGCDCHRMDLSSMVMLKDNHIWSQGSITQAVVMARSMAGFSTKVEVECSNEEEAREAIAAGADVVMLDNMSPAQLETAAASLKRDHPSVIVEASGGITVDTIQDYMVQGVDVISTSWIHQGVPHIDFSLKIKH